MRRLHGVDAFFASIVRIAMLIGIASIPARRSVLAIKANKRFDGFLNAFFVKTAWRMRLFPTAAKIDSGMDKYNETIAAVTLPLL